MRNVTMLVVSFALLACTAATPKPVPLASAPSPARPAPSPAPAVTGTVLVGNWGDQLTSYQFGADGRVTRTTQHPAMDMDCPSGCIHMAGGQDVTSGTWTLVGGRLTISYDTIVSSTGVIRLTGLAPQPEVFTVERLVSETVVEGDAYRQLRLQLELRAGNDKDRVVVWDSNETCARTKPPVPARCE
jgi:hypothetical protein